MEQATGPVVEATRTGTMTIPEAIPVHHQEAGIIPRLMQTGMMSAVLRLRPEYCWQDVSLNSAISLLWNSHDYF